MPNCLVCRSKRIEQVLDLGETALANKFLREEDLSEGELRFPLRVGFCLECGHVQLLKIVPPAEMFEDYLYVSSVSETLRNHLHSLAKRVVERFRLSGEDLVIDVGCNDGTLLQGFRRHGVRTLGVDPARNLAELTRSTQIDRVVGLFTSRTADRILASHGKAAVITATNTFPHIQDLHDFVQGVERLLRPGGALVIEAHYLVDLLEQGAFDTIYHEHVSYWALGPMTRLFEQHGMRVVEVERVPLHHGQLRVFVQRDGEGEVHPGVAAALEMERELRLGDVETYRRFAARTMEIRDSLLRTLLELRGRGKRIAGYGAPAKASTLLEFLEIGPHLVEYIADRSPLKQGRFTPGVHIPIVPPQKLLEDRPDYVVLLAWNFADEIRRQQAKYVEAGGKFILPLPEVRVDS